MYVDLNNVIYIQINDIFFAFSVRPVDAKIVAGSPDAFVAGHNAGLVCRSGGSRPFAQLSWYKNRALVTEKIEYVWLLLKNIC